MAGAEARLRRQDPDDSLLPPGGFARRAVETGLIVGIGECVIDTVSGSTMRRPFAACAEVMRRANALAHLLEPVITQTLAMQCSDEVPVPVALPRTDGAAVAIDGFGTGYSDRSRLRALAIYRIRLGCGVVVLIYEPG